MEPVGDSKLSLGLKVPRAGQGGEESSKGPIFTTGGLFFLTSNTVGKA